MKKGLTILFLVLVFSLSVNAGLFDFITGNVVANATNMSVDSTQVKESVKCVFTTSTTEQKCYSDDGKYSCVGIETCTVLVAEQTETKITWKSSCGNYAYTTADGENEYATFKCVEQTEQPAATVQATTIRPTAVVQPTTASEVLVKKCGMNSFSVNNICTEESTGNVNFRNAYFQCYDGVEAYQGSSSSCKPSELWQKYGQEFCEGHCNTNMQKTTTIPTITSVQTTPAETPIPSIQPATTVSTEISVDQTTTQTVCPLAIEINAQIQKCKDAGLGLQTQISADSETNCMKVICEKTATQESIKCNACLVDNACLPIGTRFNKQYCDVDNKMKDIKADESLCSNNFECTSNLCINDACVSGSIWKKFLSFLAGLFGG